MRNNQQEEEIKQTISYSLYREFICGHIVKILQEIYGLQYSELSKMHDEIEISLKNKTPSLYRDLFGYQTILAIVSISEVIDKIIEGDLNSSFCLVSLSFTHSLSIKISPAALAVSFLNYKLLQRKNDDISSSSAAEKSSNNKQNLPKITLLYFTGYYSEVDIDIICELSENVQIIMVYDSSTGGPNFSSSMNSGADEAKTEEDSRDPYQKTPFYKKSSNILLLPLACTENTINSEEIWVLFERVIFPSIIRYAPELLIINHSFNFHPNKFEDKDDPMRFNLSQHIWDHIFYQLCLILQYKVVIIPHKLIEPKEYYRKTDFSTKNPHMKEFIENVPKIYGRPWNLNYFENTYVSSLEILSGIFSIFILKTSNLLHPHREENSYRRSSRFQLCSEFLAWPHVLANARVLR